MPAAGRGANLPPPKSAPPLRNLPAAKPAAKPSPSLKGVTGSVKAGTYKPINLNRRSLEGEGRKIMQTERAKALPKPKGSGFSLLNPGAIVTQGYKNLATATGVGALNEIGKLPAEAVNIPTQAAVAAFTAAKGLKAAREGHPQELEHMGSELIHQSAVAHVAKGEFDKALKAAKEHPLNTGLEVSGIAHLLDRTAMTVKTAGSVGKADAGAAISREPKPLPETAVPKGGVSAPQKPYHQH